MQQKETYAQGAANRKIGFHQHFAEDLLVQSFFEMMETADRANTTLKY